MPSLWSSLAFAVLQHILQHKSDFIDKIPFLILYFKQGFPLHILDPPSIPQIRAVSPIQPCKGKCSLHAYIVHPILNIVTFLTQTDLNIIECRYVCSFVFVFGFHIICLCRMRVALHESTGTGCVCVRCMCDACMLLTGPFACLPSSTGLQERRLTGRPASAAP